MNSLRSILLIALLTLLTTVSVDAENKLYPIVDTDVEIYYDNSSVIQVPLKGEAFYGQDAHYQGDQPSYTDNGDGTILDNVTGLLWQQDMGDKLTFDEAVTIADTLSLGAYDDWRVPTIKELYSLILFSGSNGKMNDENSYVLFIDTDYFIQPFGDIVAGERIIDAQTWSSTEYVGKTMKSDATVFGVNFIDGRIKGDPKYIPGTNNAPYAMYFRFVRGNTAYGRNFYSDNGDGTVTDIATGLMWQQADDGAFRDWEDALSYAEQLELAGHNDWRLPNVKELQSIVDYSRSPQTTDSPAIDSVFSTTEISDPVGNPGHYPFFWTGTTHIGAFNNYSSAAYIAFGEAQGEMHGELMDVHGAGAQRSDPKAGNPDDYPVYWGPQGDVRYVFNAVRCVRDDDSLNPTGINDCLLCDGCPFCRDEPQALRVSAPYPNPFNPSTTIHYDLAEETHVSLVIYDLLGREVNTIENRILAAGNHKAIWNGDTKNGEAVGSGVYFYKISSNSLIETGKLLFVR